MAAATRTRTDEFAEVFAAERDRAVRLAYLLCGDADRAHDVVAEAFARVYPVWRAGRITDLRAYVRRAVANEANSTLRRRYREQAFVRRRHGDDRGVRLVDEHAAEQDAVWQAIQRLPDRQRQVMVLRYYEDLNEAQIAATLGISPGTVKSQASRALDRLRTLMEGDR